MGNDESILDYQKKKRESLIFVRKHRFTLEGTNLADSYVKNVDINFIKKTLKVELYGVLVDGIFTCHEWLEKFEDEPDEYFVLTTYDGCGVEFFKYIFSKPKLEDETESFDYSDSNETTLTAVFSFNKIKRLTNFGRFAPRVKV